MSCIFLILPLPEFMFALVDLLYQTEPQTPFFVVPVVVQSLLCLTLCNIMDCSTSDFPVLHYFLKFAQIHVHQFNDAM